MSNRHEVEGRTIHPRALKELGEEACIIALGVARDLRSGVIPADKFDMRFIHARCGSACCIAGWMMIRGAGRETLNAVVRNMSDLFAGHHPSDPQLAADAIERYIYNGSETPWEP